MGVLGGSIYWGEVSSKDGTGKVVCTGNAQFTMKTTSKSRMFTDLFAAIECSGVSYGYPSGQGGQWTAETTYNGIPYGWGGGEEGFRFGQTTSGFIVGEPYTIKFTPTGYCYQYSVKLLYGLGAGWILWKGQDFTLPVP
jgi:hypothetical protein